MEKSQLKPLVSNKASPNPNLGANVELLYKYDITSLTSSPKFAF